MAPVATPFFFYLLAGVMIIGGILVITRKNAVHSALALIVTVGAFVASTTRMYMWWGGSSAPARFLVPILPLLAPMIAVAFEGLRSAWRTTFTILLFVSLAVAAFECCNCFESRSGGMDRGFPRSRRRRGVGIERASACRAIIS